MKTQILEHISWEVELGAEAGLKPSTPVGEAGMPKQPLTTVPGPCFLGQVLSLGLRGGCHDKVVCHLLLFANF